MKLSVLLAASAMAVANAHTVRRGRDLGKSSHHYPGPPPKFPPPPKHWGASYDDSSSSSKSSKSSSSKSGKSSSSKSGKSSKGGNFKYVWVEGPAHNHWGGHPEKPPPPPFWHGSSSSSKSGKSSSSKSGKGSWGSSSSKSGKSSGKSGKGSWGSSSSSKSSKGSSKSSKGSIEYHHIWVDNDAWGQWGPPPFPFPYGKSGKSTSKYGKGTHHFAFYHPKPKPETNDDDAWGQDDAPEVSENDWNDDGHDDEAWDDDGHDDEAWDDDGHDDEAWDDDGHDDEAWEDDGHDDDYSPVVSWEDDGHDDGAWDDDGHDDGAWDDDRHDDGAWDDDGHDDDGTGHYPNDVCFQKGEIVSCDGAPKGDAILVEFSYTAETSGVNPEDTVSDIEGAILAGAVDYVSSFDSSYGGVTRVSSSPEDYISDEETCTSNHDAHDCSIVKGEMTVYSDDHTLDACDYSIIIEASMDSADFSDISGVKNVEYLDSGSCAGTSKIVSGEAAVTEEEGLSAGAMIGLAMLGALVAAIALLLARKFRRKPNSSDRDFDLISVDTDYEGKRFGSNDPFASTVDVHKCTSMYCNCNKGGTGTTFLPAPRKSNMAKVIKKQGLDTTSPTGVDEAEAQGFFVGDSEPLEAVSMESDESSMSQNSSQPKDAIIRADPSPEEGRALTPVREVAHDSEIDTELESDGEEDLDSIPPPPPLPPGMKPKNNSLEADEMSV